MKKGMRTASAATLVVKSVKDPGHVVGVGRWEKNAAQYTRNS